LKKRAWARVKYCARDGVQACQDYDHEEPIHANAIVRRPFPLSPPGPGDPFDSGRVSVWRRPIVAGESERVHKRIVAQKVTQWLRNGALAGFDLCCMAGQLLITAFTLQCSGWADCGVSGNKSARRCSLFCFAAFRLLRGGFVCCPLNEGRDLDGMREQNDMAGRNGDRFRVHLLCLSFFELR
jgi:hypothetical protein